MSARPVPTLAPVSRPRTTFASLAALKAGREPIAMVTAYDYPSAQIADAAGVDIVLVGDSAAMTVLGYESTVPVTVDEMLMLTAAVRRGLTRPLLVADLPFGSYEASDEQAVATAQRFIKTAGADAVKIERGGSSVDRARALVAAGIPVMGHVGLTPQTAATIGGYRAQGRTAEEALVVCRNAVALEDAGCFAIVFEAIPSPVTDAIMPHLGVPVIGIGAGAGTDGQVLVFHDLLGIYDGRAARFVKRYANLREPMIAAVTEYADDVRARRYPQPEHSYAMASDEAGRFRRLLAEHDGARAPARELEGRHRLFTDELARPAMR
jgi:3-methyl-2-oxobutanoate hydroxymethyltransferase